MNKSVEVFNRYFLFSNRHRQNCCEEKYGNSFFLFSLIFTFGQQWACSGSHPIVVGSVALIKIVVLCIVVLWFSPFSGGR